MSCDKSLSLAQLYCSTMLISEETRSSENLENLKKIFCFFLSLTHLIWHWESRSTSFCCFVLQVGECHWGGHSFIAPPAVCDCWNSCVEHNKATCCIWTHAIDCCDNIITSCIFGKMDTSWPPLSSWLLYIFMWSHLFFILLDETSELHFK